MLNCNPPLTIATSRYQASSSIVASGLAAVATSVGIPRWELGYRLADHAKLLAPYGLLDVEDEAEFTARYLERLERYGVRKILAVLAGIARREETHGAVLLCWEDLTKPGAWCHRRTFALWIEKQTGQHVPELGTDHDDEPRQHGGIS